jgi:hypothetical protein
MTWEKTSHCSWDKGAMRIVQQYCPREGGVRFKLFDGAKVTMHMTLEAAMEAAK